MRTKNLMEFVPLARLAKKCGLSVATLLEPLAKGEFGEGELQRASNNWDARWLVPAELARQVEEFHASHVSRNRLCRRLRRHNDIVKRAIEALASLPEDHPVIKQIGGRVEIVKKGRLQYYPNEAEQRLRQYLNEYVTLTHVAAKIKNPHFAIANLARQLEKGIWEGFSALKVNRERRVHKSLVSSIRTFLKTHYTTAQLMKRAGVARGVVSGWTGKGLAYVEAHPLARYYPKSIVDPLIPLAKAGINLSKKDIENPLQAAVTFKTHYSKEQAQKLAKVSKDTLRHWITGGFPTTSLGKEKFFPKQGFEELAKAFKAGPASARQAVDEFNRLNTKISFNPKELTAILGISNQNALSAALGVLNAHCTNRAEQQEFIEAVNSFKTDEIDERQPAARQEFCKLALQAGGLKTGKGKTLATLVKHPASLAIKYNWLVRASSWPEGDRIEMLQNLVSGSENLDDIIRRNRQSENRKGWKGVEDKSAEKPFPIIKMEKKKGSWNQKITAKRGK